MHELGIAAEIVDIAAARAEGGRVVRLVVEVGALTAVFVDSVRFCFEAVSAGTPVEGAALEVVEVPGEGRCRACGVVAALTQALTECACGAWDFEWTKGHELRVREVEVEVAPCA